MDASFYITNVKNLVKNISFSDFLEITFEGQFIDSKNYLSNFQNNKLTLSNS